MIKKWWTTSNSEVAVKRRLRKRLNYLWTFELANALLVFPGVYYFISLNYRLGWFSFISLAVVCAILIIGAAFWFLKKRTLDGSEFLFQLSVRHFFRASKIVFGAALLVLFVLFVIRAFGQKAVPPADLVVGSILTILVGLEYVNYYFVQLSYDNRADIQYLLRHRRLKRAIMVRELNI